MMKHLNILIFCFCSTFLFSQKETKGILLTSNDFKQNKISHEMKETDHYKLNSGSIFNPSRVLLKINNQKFTFHKDSIFGIVENQNYFRFYNKNKYSILNPTENILIYAKKSFPKGKGSIQEIHYYFSKNADSSIEELTMNNLKNAFVSNQKIIDIIDLHFRNDSELIEYDSINRIYKLNRILSKLN